MRDEGKLGLEEGSVCDLVRIELWAISVTIRGWVVSLLSLWEQINDVYA